MTNTPEDLTTWLDEQQAIADAASEGPWYPDVEAGSVYVRSGTWEDDDGNEKPYEEAIFEDRSAVAYKDGPPNVAFIAASRETVPRLIEIARELQAKLIEADWLIKQASFGCWCDRRHDDPSCPVVRARAYLGLPEARE